MMAKGRGRQEVRGSSLLKNIKNKSPVRMRRLSVSVCCAGVLHRCVLLPVAEL